MSISTLISRWVGKHAAPAVTQPFFSPDEVASMTVPSSAANAALNAAVASPTAVNQSEDVLLDKLKAVLTTAGHDVEAVWDEAVALAKKLV